MSIESLGQYFGAIEDPHCSGKVEHRLLDILVIAMSVNRAGFAGGMLA